MHLRAGRRLDNAALVADGHHALADGLVSLGVVAGALTVALGARLAPLIGLAIALFILRITVDSWRTVKHDRTRSAGSPRVAEMRSAREARRERPA